MVTNSYNKICCDSLRQDKFTMALFKGNEITDLAKKMANTLLDDPVNEERESTSDRMSASTTVNAGSIVQSSVKPAGPFYADLSVNDLSHSMGYKTGFAVSNPSKMVYLGSYVMTTGHSFLGDRLGIPLPSAFWNDRKKPAWGPSRYFKFVRCSFHFQIMINAPMGASGSILVAYTPFHLRGIQDTLNKASLTMLPHVIVNIATMTQADLMVPYISDRNYVNVDSNELGNLVLFTLSDLRLAGSTSNSVDVSVFGCFVELDFQGPRPFVNQSPNKFKYVRNKVDIAEGPGMMNLANVLSTTGGQSIALSGEKAIFDRKVTGTTKRIANFKELLGVDCLMLNSGGHVAESSCKFPWGANQGPQTAIFQENLSLFTFGIASFFGRQYQFWRGSLVLTFQVIATPMHRGRLLVAVNPSGSQDFDFVEAQNLLYTIFDIGLNSTVSITIPFTSQTWLARCNSDYIFRIKVFVMNRLVHNTAASNVVDVLAFARCGDDFQFYTPQSSSYSIQGEVKENLNQGELESQNVDYSNSDGLAQKVGLSSMENSGTQENMVEKENPTFINYDIVAHECFMRDHMDLDVFFGRAWFVGTMNLSGTTMDSRILVCPTRTHASLMRIFEFWSGELNIHVANNAEVNIEVTHSYENQISMVSSSSTGSVLIPPREMATICAPFYSRTPVRRVKGVGNDDAVFGILYARSLGTTGSVDIWLSLRSNSFTFPIPFPKQSTSRSMLENPNAFTTMEVAREVIEIFKKEGDVTMDMPSSRPKNELEEYVQNAVSFFNLRIGSRSETLLQCGDIESNPGPAELVYKERGIYKHYGIRLDDEIFEMDSENIVDSILSGHVQIVKRKDDGQWKVEMTYPLDYFARQYCENQIGRKIKFSCVENCETWARKMFPTMKMSQSLALGFFGSLLCAASLSAIAFKEVSFSSLSNYYSQCPEDSQAGLIQRVTTWFSSMFVDTIEADLIKFLSLALVRLVCYLTMYAHSPNLLNTIALGALLFMDVRSLGLISKDAKVLIGCLVEGDVKGLCTKIAEKMHGVGSTDEENTDDAVETMRYAKELLSDEGEYMDDDFGSFQKYEDAQDFQKFVGQDVRDFNNGTQAAKNIEWWIQVFKRIKDWFMKFLRPSTSQKFHNWLEQHKKSIADLMTTVDRHLIDCNDVSNLRRLRFHEKHKWLLSLLNHVIDGFVMYSCSSPILSHLRFLQSHMMKVQLQTIYNTTVTRVEPVGVCIRGGPGVGKSFFTNLLMKRVCEQMNWDLNTEVFPHPIGSEYFDGYHGQKIHYIDDMGQNLDEKDLSVLCQCISTIPFTVPMAALEEKGMMYNSCLVISTTNKFDFSSRTLLDPGALERRFKKTLTIRPKPNFADPNGKLQVAKFMEYVTKGEAWQYTVDGYLWNDFDMEDFVSEVCGELKMKLEAHAHWNDFMKQYQVSKSDEHKMKMNSLVSVFTTQAETPFHDWVDTWTRITETTTEALFEFLDSKQKKQGWGFKLSQATIKIKDWVNSKVKSLGNFIQKNQKWFVLFSAIGTALGIIISVWYLVSKTKKNDEEERPYNPMTTVTKPHSRFQIGKGLTVLPKSQAPFVSEMAYLFDRTAYIRCQVTNQIVHCLPIGGCYVIVYAHARYLLQTMVKPELIYKGRLVEIQNCDIRDISYFKGSMDLSILEFKKLPFLFKSVSDMITEEIGVQSMLIWTCDKGYLTFPVSNVHKFGVLETMEGHVTVDSIGYVGQTVKGMCGGILVTKVHGSYKILGMHIAGNGTMGMSASLALIKNIPVTQGLVEKKEPLDFKIHQSSRSKLKPSPLFENWPVEMQPAVLSPYDPRIEKEKPFPVLKNAAMKYRVNVFNPPPGFQKIRSHLTFGLLDVFGVNDSCSIEEVCFNEESEHALDLSTSPGLKYTSMNLRKKDLIKREQKFIHPQLRKDVQEMLEALKEGREIKVYFQAHLKDELRKNEKIPEAKTRCIEASDFDFVVAHKMIFGPLYEKIYASNAYETGLAVGMNPWKDWNVMERALFRFNYDFDFKAFDGSLSRELMKEASMVLCACVAEDEIAERMLSYVIDSQHIVLDEIWQVKGGMPSGSPCTTVLNSVCNILVSASVALHCTEGNYKVLTYGDDLIISCEQPLDCLKFQSMVADCFGMEVTPGDKGEQFSVKTPNKISFLKRVPKKFPGTNFTVGALDLENIKQHLMWCKNIDAFKSQIDSALMEVALHGKDVYDDFRRDIKDKLDKVGISIPKFESMIERMSFYVFD